jgi:hypothetical protein
MKVLNEGLSRNDDIYLVHTRNFVVNEIESDVVYLQNKTIGKNHVQNVPSYKYRAWYKAYTRIEIGNLVTPQTDPGDYIIEATGDITVYAGESVILKPGFHAQNGSTFHAFIKRECAKPPANVQDNTTFHQPENLEGFGVYLANNIENFDVPIVLDSVTKNTIEELCQDFTLLRISNMPVNPSPLPISQDLAINAIINEDEF